MSHNLFVYICLFACIVQRSFQAYGVNEGEMPQAQAMRFKVYSKKRDEHDDKNGINDCPNSCLCSNNIKFDYKVCV